MYIIIAILTLLTTSANACFVESKVASLYSLNCETPPSKVKLYDSKGNELTIISATKNEVIADAGQSNIEIGSLLFESHPSPRPNKHGELHNHSSTDSLNTGNTKIRLLAQTLNFNGSSAKLDNASVDIDFSENNIKSANIKLRIEHEFEGFRLILIPSLTSESGEAIFAKNLNNIKYGLSIIGDKNQSTTKLDSSNLSSIFETFFASAYFEHNSKNSDESSFESILRFGFYKATIDNGSSGLSCIMDGAAASAEVKYIYNVGKNSYAGFGAGLFYAHAVINGRRSYSSVSENIKIYKWNVDLLEFIYDF